MGELYIIAGLGNPGRQYDRTRHNVGFEVIDRLEGRLRMASSEKFSKSIAVRGFLGERKVLLLKPQTYMNLSGEAIREAVSYYKADHHSHLIVICDDINLATGQLRIRGKGSAGGHNGLKNIILHLGDEAFCRIRVGVGAKPDPSGDLANHVLGHFSGEDARVMEEAEERAADAVTAILEDGTEKAMNLFNTRASGKDTGKEAEKEIKKETI